MFEERPAKEVAPTEKRAQPNVLKFLTDVEALKTQAYAAIRTPDGHIPENSGTLILNYMLEHAQAENPQLVPIIRSEFSVVAEGTEARTHVGEQMDGELSVTGHISRSVLWLIDTQADRLQTMVRLLVERDNARSLIDVYSDPHEGFIHPKTRVPYISDTIPSRTRRVLQLARDGYEIQGWVDIEEIEAQTVPQYA